MEQKRVKYESIFVVNTALGEEAIQAIVEKFTSLIAANGEIESVNEWGNRKLAYPIDDLTDGYYVLVKFESAPDFPAELDRIFNITDGLLRSLIVAREEE
ncbi:MAG: 30S ribosomal protein S6 [Clostridia bacterium]|nr:30S ribosomal protein S6 [Clostridia bacterium]